MQILTLFRIRLFRDAHELRGGRGQKGSPLKSVAHILQRPNLAQLYLGTVIPQNKESRDTTPELC